MKKISLALILFSTVASSVRSQTQLAESEHVSRPASSSRTWLPHNWVRGYTDFAVAPSHNEPDLGRCMFPQPASAGGSASTCTAYARYLLSSYIEIQPLGRTPLRHLFLFFEPKFSFGRNIPQLSYDESMEPIAYDRAIGVGFQLPKNFELRATQHQVDYLGRYGKPLGTADLRTNGPYGLYSTFSVRWTFGGYGHAGAPSSY
ncbi:MAG TPA: hypothetical protein VMO76_00515 [Candidatus Udaeobacter sp.]|nr:hypothetical protein [Candidatus Udaeobacter sp.]